MLSLDQIYKPKSGHLRNSRRNFSSTSSINSDYTTTNSRITQTTNNSTSNISRVDSASTINTQPKQNNNLNSDSGHFVQSKRNNNLNSDSGHFVQSKRNNNLNSDSGHFGRAKRFSNPNSDSGHFNRASSHNSRASTKSVNYINNNQVVVDKKSKEFSLPVIKDSKKSTSSLILKRSSSTSSATKKSKVPDENKLRRDQFKAESMKELDNSSKYAKTVMRHKYPIRVFDTIPNSSMPPLHIVNQAEVKKKFLESQIPPVLKFRVDNDQAQKIVSKHGSPNFHYFFRAKNILDFVKAKFPSGMADDYFEGNFGPRIDNKEVIDIVGDYLKANKIQGDIAINFAPGQTCQGRITTYSVSKKEPEKRTYAIWINNGRENQYLRKKGIGCLLDHELGTHYFRSYNDGLQPWYAKRKKYGLRPASSCELLKTEEGIACIHTVMRANVKYLFLPALLYYLACMGETMTFEQLYNHMETYVKDENERWKLVTRVKRGISDPNTVGSYARDQAYFEGACRILENIDNIDFKLLMSGKICLDELDSLADVAKLENIRLPKFFKNMKKYKEKIRQIAVVNGLIEYKPESAESKNGLAQDIDDLKTNVEDSIPEEECEILKPLENL